MVVSADDLVSKNLLFAGTTVQSGECYMLVQKVGINTENAKTLLSMRNIDEVKTDLDVTGDSTLNGDVTVNGSLNIQDETVLDTFHVRGDSFLDGEVVASDDVHIKGDLIIDGKTYTTEEESIETSSNYAVLRKNNPSPLGANEKSGIVVHNYAANKNAFIGVDRDGTFRISDNAAEQTTTYTDVLYYNGTRRYIFA